MCFKVQITENRLLIENRKKKKKKKPAKPQKKMLEFQDLKKNLFNMWLYKSHLDFFKPQFLYL